MIADTIIAISSVIEEMDAVTIMAISSGVIALVALFVAVSEAIAKRKHYRLSVTPHLVFGRKIDVVDTHSAWIILENRGIGPAVIKSCEIYVDNKVNQSFDATQWRTVVSEIGLKYDDVKGQDLPTDISITIDEMIELLNVHLAVPLPSEKEILNALLRLNIIIKYESYYGDKFRIELNADLKNPKSNP
jgi:hypothetical protein